MLNVKKYTPYVFLLPSVIAMLIIIYIPLFMGISYSFTDITQRNANKIEYVIPQVESNGIITLKVEEKTKPVHFIGLKKYGECLAEPMFWQVLAQTMIWTIGCVFFHFFIGLGLALLLNKNIKFKTTYRILLLVPWAVPTYISAFSWRWLFNADYGVFNQLLKALSLEPISWLSHPQWGMFAVILTNIWLGFPFMMVTLLGGLQNIPTELYEAATVDGASKWQQFKNVTMPLLKPVSMTVVLLGFIWTFNMFNIIYLVTQDNPHTDILATFAFKEFFVKGEYASASAYSVIILLLLMFFSFIQIKYQKNESLY